MDITTKTRKMVEKGLVLDERGNWVSLVDKLGKEQTFMNRLESGEVLYENKWMPIHEVKAAVIVEDSSESKEINDIQKEEKPIVTVSEKHDTSGQSEKFEIPETNEMLTQSVQFYDDKEKENQFTFHASTENLFYNHAENETVFIKMGSLPQFDDDDELIAIQNARAKSKAASIPIHEDVKELLQSFEEFDVWEKAARKRQAIFFAVTSSIAAAIGCFAILLLLFI